MSVLRLTVLTSVLAAASALLSGCGSDQATAEPAASAAPSHDPASAAKDAPSPSPAANSDRVDAIRTLERTFDDIKFDIAPGAEFRREMLTPEIESLAGQKVRLRGYILPTPQKRGIKQFVLVRDNQECCFGPGAALYDCVLVEMQPGKTAEFSIRPVAVEGTFHIDLLTGPDDKPLAIYRMKGEAVQ